MPCCRRLRVAAAVAGCTQSDLIREGIADRLAAVESAHPEIRLLNPAA